MTGGMVKPRRDLAENLYDRYATQSCGLAVGHVPYTESEPRGLRIRTEYGTRI